MREQDVMKQTITTPDTVRQDDICILTRTVVKPMDFPIRICNEWACLT